MIYNDTTKKNRNITINAATVPCYYVSYLVFNKERNGILQYRKQTRISASNLNQT